MDQSKTILDSWKTRRKTSWNVLKMNNWHETTLICSEWPKYTALERSKNRTLECLPWLLTWITHLNFWPMEYINGSFSQISVDLMRSWKQYHRFRWRLSSAAYKWEQVNGWLERHSSYHIIMKCGKTTYWRTCYNASIMLFQRVARTLFLWHYNVVPDSRSLSCSPHLWLQPPA